MPLYEYRCDGCGETFEVIEKFADSPLTVHEKCGGAVHRLISTSAFNFKGSGWYVTDYAKNKGGKSEGNGSPKGEDSTAKAESKSDSKSESKAESKSESKSESKTEAPAASTDKSTTKSSDKKD